MDKRRVAFIVDSSIGIFGEELEKRNIKQVFFGITDSKGNVYQDDNTILNTETILKKFDEGEIFKTSAVSPGPVMELTDELLKDNDDVVLFTVSSGLSSFYQNVKFLEEEYNGKFHVVDTMTTAGKWAGNAAKWESTCCSDRCLTCFRPRGAAMG